MVWEYKWDEWFLYDDDDILRVHVFQANLDWCWFIFDLAGEVINHGKGAPTAELAKTCAKKIMAT